MGNHNLQSAKKAKYDEFYTLPKPIKDEINHYVTPINQFENKTVICNTARNGLSSGNTLQNISIVFT